MSGIRYSIETEGLVKRFGKFTALGGLDLRALPGTVLGVLGPNGAGKTTAVRILSTLLRPDGGVARILGCDVAKRPHEVRRMIGLTGQYAAVDGSLTAIQNLVLIARLLGQSRQAAKRRAGMLLERFGLSEAADRKAKLYSGGMRRRLDLAASLVGRPSVLFLDEPTTGLDPENRLELWDIVRELVADGSTVLLTTQYLEEADQLADDIVVIDRGVAVANGTAEQLKAKIDRQTLEVQPADRSRLEETERIVWELVGRRPVVEGTRLYIQVNDSALPAAVLRRLDDAGIQVNELALRQPSLDEVFLALTGRRRKTEHPSAEDQDTTSSESRREGVPA